MNTSPALEQLTSAPHTFADVFPLYQDTLLPAVRWSKPGPYSLPIKDGDCYGVPTGARNRIGVVDLDNKNGKAGEVAFQDYAQQNGFEIPTTYSVSSKSGGAHLYYLMPEGREIRNAEGLLEGVDFRGDGGFVRAGGPNYTVLHNLPIAPMPEWIVDFVTAKRSATTGIAVSAIAIEETDDDWNYRLDLAREYTDTEAVSVSGRGGDAQLWKMACYLTRTLELPLETCLALLTEDRGWNSRCFPPWDNAIISRKLDQAAQLGTSLPGTFSQALLAACRPPKAYPAYNYVPPAPGEVPPSTATLIDRLNAANDTLAHDRPLPAAWLAQTRIEPRKTSFTRGDHAELAHELIRTYGATLVTSEGAIWSYDPRWGVWSTEGVERRLRTTIVEDFAGIPSGDRGRPKCIDNADVEGTIRILRTLTEDTEFFSKAALGVACDNGFVTLGGIVPHAEEHRARTSYPLAFDVDATSARWETFLNDLFRDDEDRSEKIACLQEFFGGALFGLSTRFQKCIVTTGAGSNGKSTLFTIVRAMFPTGKTQSIAPKKWEHAFTLANFRGTLLNIVGDMPHGAIIDSAHFKEIVTGDTVTAEEKHKPAFPLRPIAGHIFACNHLPATGDHSFGFWRRFIVIPFMRNFENDPARDLNIAESIITTERAGVLAWLIAGARRLAAAPAYTEPGSHAATLSKWKKESNTVELFKTECTLPGNRQNRLESTGATALYTSYRNWAELSGFKPVARIQFAQRMAELGCPSEKREDGMVYPVTCTHNMQETRYTRPRNP